MGREEHLFRYVTKMFKSGHPLEKNLNLKKTISKVLKGPLGIQIFEGWRSDTKYFQNNSKSIKIQKRPR